MFSVSNAYRYYSLNSLPNAMNEWARLLINNGRKAKQQSMLANRHWPSDGVVIMIRSIELRHVADTGGWAVQPSWLLCSFSSQKVGAVLLKIVHGDIHVITLSPLNTLGMTCGVVWDARLLMAPPHS